MLNLTELQEKKPVEMAALQAITAAAVQYVEGNKPELKGPEKTAAVVDEVEQRILNFYRGVDARIYDFPPVIDLAIEIGVPHLTETVELVSSLRPLIEQMAQQTVDWFNGLIGWFGGGVK